MKYYKFIYQAVLAFLLISAVFSEKINNCGIVGDNAFPNKTSDCKLDNQTLASSGYSCCYISAIRKGSNEVVSTCALTLPGTPENIIKLAAEALGSNSKYECNGSHFIESTFLMLILALMF